MLTAQECLQRTGSSDDVPFENINSSSTHLPSGSQAIVPSYRFSCCGDIEEWKTFVHPSGTNFNNGVYSIDFQVWRPSPVVGADGEGCYSLVGHNTFPSVTFSALDSISLSVMTPQQTMIAVRPGDVLGYFVVSSRDNAEDPDERQGIQMDAP